TICHAYGASFAMVGDFGTLMVDFGTRSFALLCVINSISAKPSAKVCESLREKNTQREAVCESLRKTACLKLCCGSRREVNLREPWG
ncbi:MAG: hypothetical protein LIP02_00345, partial [Bacteroidales bacterium]|nr:hypothetical protein [Bacteroidales bacterium]